MHTEDEQPSVRGGAASEAVEDALHRYLALAPLPFAITRGPAHMLVYANDALCRLPGLAEECSIGAPIVEAFPESGRAEFAQLLDRAYADSIEMLDVRVDLSASGQGNYICSVWPVVAEDHTTEGLGVEFRQAKRSDNELDMQRQVAEQILLGALRERGLADDAEAARRRAAFLAEAGRLLAESVDRAGTLVALSKLALPTLGAWCVVDLLSANGAIERLGIFHPDPLKQLMAARLEATWTPHKTDGYGVAAMLDHARTISVTAEIESVLGSGAHGAENIRLLHEIGAGALISVPLVARAKLLGAITFISAERMDAYSEEEIQLAEDLAQRGSLALENAQLYDTAIVLQQAAESANRAKTTFLGAMSHELRTPLNAIGGYVDLIDMGLRGPVTKLQHTDLARIKTNQQHLLVLINEIINYARLGGGHVTYNVVEFSVIEHIGRAVQLVEPLIARSGLSYEKVDTGPTIVARADPEKVIQILVNLLSNAIKFTPEGGHISIETTASGGFVFIGVRDTGVGIPLNKIEKVFEPFVQLKDSLAGRESGVGLGLAISRDLARGMSGDLTVVSVEGGGSCFTLALQGYSE